MEVRVKIPKEIAAAAKARGVRVEEYVEELLSQRVGNGGFATERPGNAQEIKAWLESLAQFSEKIPPLPESITREWIYQDHE